VITPVELQLARRVEKLLRMEDAQEPEEARAQGKDEPDAGCEVSPVLLPLGRL